MTFRYDINGLRAIAVIAVVLFHFNPSWVPGGFAGVDVFFVLSGFLMTGIIFRGLKDNTFNLFKFYVDRANRIIPALSVLCFALLIFGWFYLSPIDYRALSKHVVSSMGFLSNVIYWRESGYFDAASHDKWLLHTWSLSVEWQFYIIYPIVLMVLKRYLSLASLKKLLVVGTALGFGFCVFATIKWPNPAYYLLPTRAWEMMFGGIAYLYPISLKDSQKKFVELSGLILILLSYAFISSEIPWPGHFALLPVLGSYLIIVANRQDSVLTNNPIFQALGKWSYSIYLWHWPVVVFGAYFEMGFWWLYGLPMSIILGFFSFAIVEKIRLPSFKNWLDIWKVKPAWQVFMLCLVGSYIIYSQGVLDRYTGLEKSLMASSISSQDDWNYPQKNLTVNGLDIRYIKGDGIKNILFIGASHIEQTYPYVSSLKQNYNVYYLTKGGCLVIPSMTNHKWSCSNLQDYQKLLSEISFDKIVTSLYFIDGNLPKNEDNKALEIEKRIVEYDHFLKNIKKQTKEIYLITGEPQGKWFDPKISTRFSLSSSVSENEIRDTYKIHQYTLSKLKELRGVKIIDPIKYLCHKNTCQTRSDDNEFFYKDANHMRPWYSKKYSSYLKPIFYLQ